MNILIFWIIPSIVTFCYLVISASKLLGTNYFDNILKTIIVGFSVVYPIGLVLAMICQYNSPKNVKVLYYCKHTDTLRQAPENYCIAFRKNGRWIVDPDCAVELKTSIKVLKVLHEWRYIAPEDLVESVNS